MNFNLRRQNSIRVYVRNKNRYNVETKEQGILFVDIHDFAGTTIGQIKEVNCTIHSSSVLSTHNKVKSFVICS